MPALKKKKAIPATGTAFKDGPDRTGLNTKHYIGVPMNLNCSTPVKPSPVTLITSINRG